jgi:hypothetical protein
MSGVFISYRRSDSGGWAGRLFDHLSMRFGNNLILCETIPRKIKRLLRECMIEAYGENCIEN